MVEKIFRLERRRMWSAAAAAAAALLYGAYILKGGVQVSSDSGTYSGWADALVAARFDYPAYLATQHFVVPPVLYIVWITMVAVCKVVLHDSWPAGIVFLNWLTLTALVYAMVNTTSRVTASVASGLAAVVFFAASLDVLLFLPFALSDVIFLGLSGAILLLGLSIAADPREPRGRVLAGTVLLLIGGFFRPTAPPLAVFWGGALLLAARPRLDARRAWMGIGLLTLLAAAAVAGHAAVLQAPARWSGGESGWIRQLSAEAYKGIVVFGRPETYVAPPQTLGDFIALTGRKVAYYFAPWMSGYSRVHTVAGALFFLGTYALSIVAVLRSHRWRVCVLLVLYVAAFALFHGVQQIDFDHRYRLPIIPALAVFAAVGVQALFKLGAEREPVRPVPA
jgi:hypothetical protein